MSKKSILSRVSKLVVLSIMLSLVIIPGSLPVHADSMVLSSGKAYTSSVAASATYPDTNGTELTDGTYATGGFADPAWQGRQNVGSYYQTVDLGTTDYVTDMDANFLQDAVCGIYWPGSVDFSFSNDGTSFTSLGTAVPQSSSGSFKKYRLTLPSAVNARYVRMTVATSYEWVFEDEMTVRGVYNGTMNIARSKPYSSSSEASSSYPDTNVKELTDGKYASGGYTDAAWQGRLGSYSQTINLNTCTEINRMVANFLQDTVCGIYWPGSVSFSCSNDGTNFTALGTAVAQSPAGSTKKYELTLAAPVNAKYVRIDVTAGAGNYWVFTDEAEVYGWTVVGGSFVQPGYFFTYTQADWEEELSYMKDLGMDHIIVQDIIVDTPGKEKTYYSSSVYNPGTGYIYANNQDMLLNVLNAAANEGMDVWVGLAANNDWWSHSTDSTWLNSEAAFNNNVISDIWNSSNGYSSISSFKGWYLWWEIDNVNFATQTAQQNLRTALKTVVDYAHSNTGKPVMTSPFYNASTGLGPSGWTSMWTYLLNQSGGANFDVVAPQDGFGGPYITTSNVGSWLAAMKAATDTNPGVQLWSNAENFVTGTLTAAPMIRYVDQLNTESPYVAKFTSFSFGHYHSPKVVGKEVYDDWKRFMYPRIQGKAYTGPLFGLEDKAAYKSYTASVPADTAYPDSNGTELTDTKYSGGAASDESPFQGRYNAPSYSFTVDMGADSTFDNISLNFLKAVGDDIYFPQTVEFLTSSDGISFTSRGIVSQPSSGLDTDTGKYEVDLAADITARYIKAAVTTGTSGWTMCDELGAVGDR